LKIEFNVTEEHVVSLIGRLAENKGHYDFVRAAEYALTELNDVAFVIVGDGDQAYREALEGFAEECGVRDNTIFTGYWENIADVYSLSDIIIVPSTNENLPKVIQESFVYKTPVIAKDSGGIGELVINGDTGILVDDDDEGDQLSEQIINLLSSPKYKEKIIENAADKVENEYSKNVVQSEIENVYSSVVE
jgi:glycosyltransferase involved in cell wall biosynthesis